MSATGSSVGHELDAPPWKRVELTLMATSRAIRRAYDGRLAPLGLNLSQASLLAFLDEHGPTTQTSAAHALAMGRAAAGSIIDGLQRDGFVERVSDPNDRRVWLVRLSSSGTRLIPAITSIDEALRGELRAGITKAERHALAQALVALQANLTRVLETLPEKSEAARQ